jgi:RND family efflux transporter MFP subunit
MWPKDLQRKVPSKVLNVGLCLFVILGGILTLVGLTLSKQPPTQKEIIRQPVPVVVQKVQLTDETIFLQGYGEVNALRTLTVSAEVSGRVIRVHPRLHAGEVIQEGEILFEIDSTEFEATCRQIEEQIGERKAHLDLLKQQNTADQKRLQNLQLSRDLAHNNYRRINDLLEKSKIGTRSGVEKAQQAALAADDAVDVLVSTLALYPKKIEAARRQLVEARIRLEKARRDLLRCKVQAIFDGHLKTVGLQAGDYVSQGAPLFVMSDNSILEIHVPLSSSEARRWLRFEPKLDAPDNSGWFAPLIPVICRVQWAEESDSHIWQGKLHRVVSFNPRSRTLTVAVRVAKKASMPNVQFPLVEGMFCAVSFPGKVLNNAVRLPRGALRPNQTVYLAKDNRLHTVSVRVACTRQNDVLVKMGLASGDLVIISPLPDPLENEPLKITHHDQATGDSKMAERVSS